MVSTMAFAETSSTKKKTVHKQAKHVSAKPAKKQQLASKNTKNEQSRYAFRKIYVIRRKIRWNWCQ